MSSIRDLVKLLLCLLLFFAVLPFEVNKTECIGDDHVPTWTKFHKIQGRAGRQTVIFCEEITFTSKVQERGLLIMNRRQVLWSRS